MDHQSFVDRVLAHLPSGSFDEYNFMSWQHSGRPSKEGVGVMTVPGADPAKLKAAVMDVDNYVGNIDHVVACRSVTDGRFEPPGAVRFYQKVAIPMLGSVHHELVLKDMGTRGGFEVLAWDVLRSETDALSKRDGFRSDYNQGAWLVNDAGVVAYALSSAPQRSDVGLLKWKALTRGADAAAPHVVKANIQAMVKWSNRR